jgi:hypothetical protein
MNSIIRCHGNNGYAIAPQCYVTRILPILYFILRRIQYPRQYSIDT